MFTKIKARIIAFITSEVKKALDVHATEYVKAFVEMAQTYERKFDACVEARVDARVALFKDDLTVIEKELREKFVATLKEPVDLLKAPLGHWRASAEEIAEAEALRKPRK